MRIERALALHLQQLAANGRTSHTREQIERHVLLFARWLAGERQPRDLSRITHLLVAAFLASDTVQRTARGQPRKATSANALRSSIKRFFAFCASAGLIRQDPARLVQRARCATPPPRALTTAEQHALLATLRCATDPEGRRDHVLVVLMLSTGVRVSSALGIDVTDIDFEEGEVHLRATKGDRPHRLFLPRATAKLLRRHVAGQAAGPVFVTASGKRLTRRQLARRLADWGQRADIRRRVHAHGLRHTFGQNLLARTGDIFLVQRAMHHASISSTLTYLRSVEPDVRRALA